jgi:hypothetical protein
MTEHSLSGVAKRLGLITLLAGILVALLGLLAPPASASSLLHPETRVAAIAEPNGQLVGPHADVLAVQGRERAPNYDSPATGSSVAAEGGADGIDAFDLKMSSTVEQHISDLAKDGSLARPYADSRLTIQNIMDAGTPVPDPGGVPGALRWDVPGALNGSSGTWELVVDPQTNTILHFLFKSG